jgi:hypothetical protein
LVVVFALERARLDRAGAHTRHGDVRRVQSTIGQIDVDARRDLVGDTCEALIGERRIFVAYGEGLIAKLAGWFAAELAEHPAVLTERANAAADEGMDRETGQVLGGEVDVVNDIGHDRVIVELA